ncbi:MAG: hypothetical protein Q8P53_04015 [Candidatus Shapirobacteria bacterium]|nr:hypothetical protein [Candidatus Shapirobacteria bacterium]
MHPEQRMIFGDIVNRNIARILGFNNDGATPSFGVTDIGEGEIYHTRMWNGINIVVAYVVLNGETETSYFFRTFDGLDPIGMDNLEAEEGKRQYKDWCEKVTQVISPEFKVAPNDLREKLEELSNE